MITNTDERMQLATLRGAREVGERELIEIKQKVKEKKIESYKLTGRAIQKSFNKFAMDTPAKKPLFRLKKQTAGVIVVPQQRPAEYKSTFFTEAMNQEKRSLFFT